jgi:hypothetical protein
MAHKKGQYYWRFTHISALAKQLIIDNNEIKKHIRVIQDDYRLFAKNKNDTTKWNDTKSYLIPITIPKFEIYKLSNEDKIKETIRNNKIREKLSEQIDNNAKRDRPESPNNTLSKKPHNMSNEVIEDNV